MDIISQYRCFTAQENKINWLQRLTVCSEEVFFPQLAAYLSFLQDVSVTFPISTRKEISPAPVLVACSLMSHLLCLAEVKLQVLVLSDAGVLPVSSLGPCVCVCVQCPGLCLCLTNPSYTCCSYAGLSQPTAHWIVSWMNTFSPSLCFWHSHFLSVCLSFFLPLSLSCILCISLQELTLTSKPSSDFLQKHTRTHTLAYLCFCEDLHRYSVNCTEPPQLTPDFDPDFDPDPNQILILTPTLIVHT